MLVDSHCHLDFPDLTQELDAVVERAKAAGIGCLVTISNGYQRARTGVAACGGLPVFVAPPSDYGASGYSTSSWRTEGPAPGIGTVSRTTTTTTVSPAAGATVTSSSTETARTTTRTTRRPLIISSNDPRYAQTEPPHWGEPRPK